MKKYPPGRLPPEHLICYSILNNEVYLGHSVGLRTTTISYKNKQRVERPESERFVVKNTHEALVFTAAVPVCCRIFEDLVFRADHTVIELVVDVSPPLMSAPVSYTHLDVYKRQSWVRPTR